jgi:hypothetical protein
LLQATGGDRQMLDMLVEATASPAAADRWRWKDVDAAQCSAIIETEASRLFLTHWRHAPGFLTHAANTSTLASVLSRCTTPAKGLSFFSLAL